MRGGGGGGGGAIQIAPSKWLDQGGAFSGWEVLFVSRCSSGVNDSNNSRCQVVDSKHLRRCRYSRE